MASTYNVTTNKAIFRQTLLDVFQGRELLTMMSIVVAYNTAITEVSQNAPYATIDYYQLCKEAEDDGIQPSAIKTLLERLSVA
jgi:hypothetical protein